jgi:molybdate transport repressor ModE-like protein
MLDLLNEIRVTGKITGAAVRLNLSYRHAWNLIEKWAEFLDAPLLERKRRSGTRLTLLGEKLVWAGQRLQARLGPQLQNLSQELETEINELLPRGPSTIRVHASHGFAVSKLREMLSREQGLQVDLRYVSNQNSLVSLAHDACDLAGMHFPQGELRTISFVTREMGLMVQRGNPFGIVSLDGLLNPQIRFVKSRPRFGNTLPVRPTAGATAAR